MEMASGVNHPGYGQVSDETHTTSNIVPSGRGVGEFSCLPVVRGERLEPVIENNFQLTSISDDSVFPTLDGDTASLARSYTPLPFGDQRISRPHVRESSNLLPDPGITEIPTNVKINEVQQPICPTSPYHRQSSFRQNSPPTFNDSRLFGNGSEYLHGGAIHMSYPVGQTFCPNIVSATYECVSPPISQIRVSSGQEVATSISYVQSSASQSQQVAQTARMITSINPVIPLYELPSSQRRVTYPLQSDQIYAPRVPLERNVLPLRSGVPSANLCTFRAPYDTQTSRPSLPSNQRVPPPWLNNPYIGHEASSPSYEQYQCQRISALPNPLPAYGNFSENEEAVFLSEQGVRSMGVSAQQKGNNKLCPSPTGNNTSYMGSRHQFVDGQWLITATNGRGREYKLNRQQVAKPEFAHYEVRLQTFMEWPNHSHVAPQQAASAGLYLGNEGYTRCFACGGGLDSWQPGDDPFKEHAKFYKDCPYVREVVMEKYLESTGVDCEGGGGGGRSSTTRKITTVETPGATGSYQRLNTYYIQLVEMGFPPNRVKQALKRIVDKCDQKWFDLDELLDDLKKTGEMKTSEDPMEKL